MLKQTTAFLLSIFFLAGSILLPLGDFSLMKEIPGMYHAYQKIAAPDEAGFVDFVGDYLLSGKSLLNHNKNDKQETNGLSIQFQHTASFYSFFEPEIQTLHVSVSYLNINFAPHIAFIESEGFNAELFRPPLV